MRDENLIEMLSNYCEHEKHSHVRAQKGFVKKNWADLKCQLCAAFEKQDFYQQLYSQVFLSAFKNQEHTKDDDIKAYCTQFKDIADQLTERQILKVYERIT